MVPVRDGRRGLKLRSFGMASVSDSFLFRKGGEVPGAILSSEGDRFALLARRWEATDLKDSPLLDPRKLSSVRVFSRVEEKGET